MREVLQRAALAAALLWSAAGVLYLGSGRWSLVLLVAPLVFAAGDAWAVRRKRRLAAFVDAELSRLASDDPATDFHGADVRVLDRRDRLVGLLPPTLDALRLVQAPAGERFRVRARVSRLGDPAAIRWRVDRIASDPLTAP